MKHLTLYLIPILLSPVALGCQMTKPLTEEAKQTAQVVFIGRPIKVLTFEKNPETKAQITFVNIKTLKGTHREEWVVNQPFDWFRKNKNLEDFKKQYGSEVEVGLKLNPDQGNIPTLVGTGVCGTPYLVKKN